MSTHLGIRLRISIPSLAFRGSQSVILDVNSDHLHYIAKFGGAGPADPEGWHELIPGQDMAFTGAGDIKVEVQPVDLPDYVPED